MFYFEMRRGGCRWIQQSSCPVGIPVGIRLAFPRPSNLVTFWGDTKNLQSSYSSSFLLKNTHENQIKTHYKNLRMSDKTNIGKSKKPNVVEDPKQ